MEAADLYNKSSSIDAVASTYEILVIKHKSSVDAVASTYEIVLEDIERDRPEYTLDEDHQKVQGVILKPPDPSKNDRVLVLKKTLSCSYLNLAFDKEVQKEYEKLQLDQLQLSQAYHLDVGQCQVIQRLNIDVTGSAQHSLSSPLERSKKMEPNYSDVSNVKEHSYGESYHIQSGTHMTPSRIACWMRRKLRKMLCKILRIKEKPVDESHTSYEVEGEWILPLVLRPKHDMCSPLPTP